MEPRTITASEFKKDCLALLDRVTETGVPIVVTKHGRPVARLVPLDDGPRRSLERSVTLLATEDEAYYSSGEVWHEAPAAP